MENFGSRNSSHSTQDGTTPPTVVKASPTADGREKTEPSPATRVACDACRERKIRCNRHRPVCGRCVKLGITCRYSSRSTSTPSKLDLSRILTTLNKRLRVISEKTPAMHNMMV
ncbi:Zn2/Cys6 DNA-binding protein [Glarea lozoyensis ATCC 20868]|uniref:Zn2/Cys6 DNA-binding protein n=1 Tax=Glarea lozoyensis (strain ATCC 20868 / MF5171) TaxID=1116229 RepID=S3DYK1_GLAL2|nr:Zn2/Cys6 DNA-binding protein [Glarea lozoyensis ATCC 20868]EPE37021.1 Zn2/Cys6 DNA-binding protein [Glarea lozoyensis ATCC 20868]